MFHIESMDKSIIFLVNELFLEEDREKEKVEVLRTLAYIRDTLKRFMIPDSLKIKKTDNE